MSVTLGASLDALLRRSVSGDPRVPGVVAVATDRSANIYEGAAGKRVLGEDAEMTTDSIFAIFSTTKAITATALLQLVEEGKVDLDAPAKTYVPEIAALKVLDGFDDKGLPKLRPPKRDITPRMLLLHSAGFGYEFFNAHYNRLVDEHGQVSVISSSRAALDTPLLFDPGDQWEYGSGIDWAGLIVERMTGKSLGQVMQERIFGPLGMTSTAFRMTPTMRAKLARIHQREADGSLKALLDFELPAEPELEMGGHGLYGTALDYAKFIRMWLNDGAGAHGRVLKKETVEMAVQNGLGELKIKGLPGIIPWITNDAEFFPGMAKSWALSFMINDSDAPTGRPAGSLAWAGLANLYYWIDRKNGIGGYWATQILPFADPASIGGYLEFETTVYQSLTSQKAA